MSLIDSDGKLIKRGIADTVKTLSDHAVSATVVLVGVADSVGELIEEHESVERALIQVHMPRMSYKEVEEIVTTGMNRLSLSVDSHALRRICILAQGLPLQRIGEKRRFRFRFKNPLMQ